MDNYLENLEYDEDSEYILSFIEELQKQGLTTNVDFKKAEEEEKLIKSKNEELNTFKETKESLIK